MILILKLHCVYSELKKIKVVIYPIGNVPYLYGEKSWIRPITVVEGKFNDETIENPNFSKLDKINFPNVSSKHQIILRVMMYCHSIQEKIGMK